MTKQKTVTSSIQIVLNGIIYWISESAYTSFKALKIDADIAVFSDESKTQPAISNGKSLMIKMSNVAKQSIQELS